MNPRHSPMGSALADFRQARQEAAMQEVLARVTGQSARLLPFDEAYKRLRPKGMVDRGRREIPVQAIVGSVNRYTDFTRTFLPRIDADAQRWATVKALATEPGGVGLPPIQVYQIGEAYFVSDGNHRVSIARQLGAPTIEAYVTEVQTRVPLSATAGLEELILKSEYADFLEQTRLDETRPRSKLLVTVPGQYLILHAQIDAHRQELASARGEEVPIHEAAASWFETVYQPVVLTIRDRGLLKEFPKRTETDLYVFVSEHREDLEAELGWAVRPQAAAASLTARRAGSGLLGPLQDGPATGKWREARIADRYVDRLFADILVPLSGADAGWRALHQALVIAQRDGSNIKGLHIGEAEKGEATLNAMREQFNRLCSEAGVKGSLALETGEVAAVICRRAVLADLVVVNVAHPPAAQALARWSNGLRNIIRRCAQPVLAVPGDAKPLANILLAFDGSPKAKEALFVATYFAEQWKSSLSVVTVGEPDSLDFVRRYLEMHELSARIITVEAEHDEAAEAILNTGSDLNSELILMGGYSKSPMVELVVGSTVDQVLRKSAVPVLVCR